MKLIEKTCPKCGANLEFEPGAKEVKCSYCNKEFIIEGNDNNSENFNSEDIKLISNALNLYTIGLLFSQYFFQVLIYFLKIINI